MARSGALAAFVLVGIAATGTAAQAQSLVRLGEEGAPHCVEPTPCETIDECPTSTSCEPLLTSDLFYCVLGADGKYEILCCDPDADLACPERFGVAGTCVGVEELGTGVCEYPGELRRFCERDDGSVESEEITRCFRSPTGTIVEDWREGDCDEDGIANGVEGAACLCDASCPAEEKDGGVPSTDAGTAEDGGSSPDDDDGGTSEGDASVEPVEDAGSTDGDGGSGMEADAGDGSGPGDGKDDGPPAAEDDGAFSFQGAGGCSCRAGGSEGAAPIGAALLLLVVGWRLRRRP